MNKTEPTESDQRLEAAFSQLMQSCFMINRALIAASAQLTRDTGITGAQWGVLGVFGGGARSKTVAQAARQLGQTRQGVQRVADLLAEKGLLEYRRNPNHRRAKLAIVTDRGRELLDRLEERELEWARQASGDLEIAELGAATQLIRRISTRLTD